MILKSLQNLILRIKLYFPCFALEREDGEDMYDEIVFEFENGYKLKIAMDIADYMSVAEIKLSNI